jgi:phosphohistidine phosphatase
MFFFQRRRAGTFGSRFAKRARQRSSGQNMKTLYLLRHAKSSWKDTELSDFDRPLNGRGREAALLVGQYIRKKKIRPELLLCSPAERARQTAALVRDSAGLAVEMRYDERIYGADVARLLEVVSQSEESAGVVMLVGHNPGLEELLELLTGERHHLSTATLACVTLEVEKWSKTRASAGRLDSLLKPKELGD